MQDINYKALNMPSPILETQNPTNIAEYSVSEISKAIKQMVEENFEYVRVRGEISGLKVATSGHAYFNLKDANSLLSCTLWRHSMAKISFKPEEGLEIVAIGKITTYAGQSKYQMTVESIEIAGVGALMQQFEKLKALFIKEGLFDNSRKKPLPFFPKILGIVTSLSGAVIKDIMHRIEDRCPIRVVIWPVTVQGTLAAGEIAEAINSFNNYEALNIPKVDIIIVARGGGSIEDLWAFNEEIVVRSAANSNIPLISAVGHETDFTLIDFAADVRAPTPTAAAEFAVPVHAQLCLNVAENNYRLYNSITKYISSIQSSLKYQAALLPEALDIVLAKEQRIDELYMRLQDSLPKLLKIKSMYLSRYSLTLISPEKIIKLKKQKLDYVIQNLIFSLGRLHEKKSSKLMQLTSSIKIISLQNYLNRKINHFSKFENNLLLSIKRVINIHISKLDKYASLLNSFDYHRVLKRGFAIVRADNGKVLSSVHQAKKDISIEFHDGKISANIKNNPA